MRKVICFLAGCFATFNAITQSDKIIAKTIKDTLPLNKTGGFIAELDAAPGIVFYEKPNYAGASASMKRKADGKLGLPFPMQNISFRVPEGKIVYIKECGDEFPFERAYATSQHSINLEKICEIRTDEAVLISIIFNGISTEVHNYDCMRFSGAIKVSVMEKSPTDPSITTAMPGITRSGRRSVAGVYTPTIFDWNSRQLRDRRYDPRYNNTGTIFNNNPVPVLTDTAKDYFGRTKDMYTVSFYTGKKALLEKRAGLWVNTDLVSSHKTCDLCDDFSSRIKMESPASEFFPFNTVFGGGRIVNADNPRIVAGPYTAKGSRDGFAITATAGTIKNFRVHLSVLGL